MNHQILDANPYPREVLAEDLLKPMELSQNGLTNAVKVPPRCITEIVLAYSHYPFLINRMRKTAPSPVDWIDPAEAIARRALTLLEQIAPIPHGTEPVLDDDVAVFTSGAAEFALRRLMGGFGLRG